MELRKLGMHGTNAGQACRQAARRGVTPAAAAGLIEYYRDQRHAYGVGALHYALQNHQAGDRPADSFPPPDSEAVGLARRQAEAERRAGEQARQREADRLAQLEADATARLGDSLERRHGRQLDSLATDQVGALIDRRFDQRAATWRRVFRQSGVAHSVLRFELLTAIDEGGVT